MATGCVFGPTLPSPAFRMSISTSPGSSASSSESPRSATTFSFAMRYMAEMRSPQSPQSPGGNDIVPKIEELEEDSAIDPKIESPREDDEGANATPSGTATETVTRRPRGRPRKHPISPPNTISKAPKGRSKTSCITCRRRKKKCDEMRPHCTF
jgi:hypothetical protein